MSDGRSQTSAPSAGPSKAAWLVRDLAAVDRGDVATAGIKGATLGGLLAAGFPVPAGFVVGAAAYEAFVTETGLSDRVAERLQALDVDDPARRSQAAADIHVGIVATPLPDAVRTAIVEAYLALSGLAPPATVAVRSSTTTQHAGPHQLAHPSATFLCVRGIDAVVGAVRECWASLFDERALLAREKLGWWQAPLRLAVVVQQQIHATRAGLLVTGDLRRGEDERLVIEASYGLGQAPASGLVTPDRYAVDKRSLRILTRETHRKDLVVEEAPLGGGTRQRAVDGDQAAEQALVDREIRMLAELGAKVEDSLGRPQVVEWALDRHGQAWILQSNPLGSARTVDRAA